MSSTKWAAGCLVVVCLGLPGCRGEDEEQLQARLMQMESRLQVLEAGPPLEFALHQVRYELEEKTFTPLLVAEASLEARGDGLPAAFYVDMMLSVTVNDIQYTAVERQIFPVVDGKCEVTIQHALPQHGLTPGQMQISLRPMTWYEGRVIDSDRLSVK